MGIITIGELRKKLKRAEELEIEIELKRNSMGGDSIWGEIRELENLERELNYIEGESLETVEYDED